MQSYGLKLITAPATEPLTTAEAKAHLRVEHNDEDSLIDGYTKAARELVEARTGVQLVTATWDLTFERFPCGREALKLPKWPTQSVTSIAFNDTAGAPQTWNALEYRVDVTRQPARVTPRVDYSFPSVIREPNAVTVRAVAGYGAAAAVPQAAKQAILLLLAHLYEQRGDAAPQVTEDVWLAVDSWLRLLDNGEWFG